MATRKIRWTTKSKLYTLGGMNPLAEANLFIKRGKRAWPIATTKLFSTKAEAITRAKELPFAKIRKVKNKWGVFTPHGYQKISADLLDPAKKGVGLLK